MHKMGQDGPRRKPERAEPIPPVLPQLVPDLAFLQAEGEDLLGHDVAWLWRRQYRLDPAPAPQQQQPGRVQQPTVVQREEQAVALGSRPPSAAADALQERRHSGRRVDLDDPVQVTDVHAEFQGARRHDHAVLGVGEGLLRAAPFVQGQGRVGQERGHPAGQQRAPEFLHQPPRVAEHQPLLAPVQSRDHPVRRCRPSPHSQAGRHPLGETADGAGGAVPICGYGQVRCQADHAGCHNLPQALAGAGPLQPGQQFAGVPDGGRQPDPLQGLAGHPGQPLQHRQQMPAAVVTGEGMDLIDHHRPQRREQPAMVNLGADQHRFQRFRSGQQHVGRIAQQPRRAPRSSHLRATVPRGGRASQRRSPAGGAGC